MAFSSRATSSYTDRLTQLGRKEPMAQAKHGDVIVIDVRPREEYDTAHLPYARSLPLAELAKRLGVWAADALMPG